MAVALLLTTALALAGFLATSAQGFAVASAVHSAAPLAGHLVTRHVGYAIPTVLFSLFSQSMVIFYFIGTGRLVKDETAGYPRRTAAKSMRPCGASRRAPRPRHVRAPSPRSACLFGGAVHTKALPPWTHLASSVAAAAVHAWALAAEWTTFRENHRLMEDPAAYVRSPTLSS
jgi:hypothetical protein